MADRAYRRPVAMRTDRSSRPSPWLAVAVAIATTVVIHAGAGLGLALIEAPEDEPPCPTQVEMCVERCRWDREPFVPSRCEAERRLVLAHQGEGVAVLGGPRNVARLSMTAGHCAALLMRKPGHSRIGGKSGVCGRRAFARPFVLVVRAPRASVLASRWRGGCPRGPG